MKAAVSIPDDVFNEAEDFARRPNVSRSELYATALRALLAQSECNRHCRRGGVHVRRPPWNGPGHVDNLTMDAISRGSGRAFTL